MSLKDVEIEIFKVGTHRPTSGEPVTFSADDLAQAAANYDPKDFDAPLVIGHPKTDGPAYGWVRGLRLAGDKLMARMGVTPEAVDLVKNGNFKKVSASFYLPKAASNPHKGQLALRHVGLLGAAAPAIPSLAAVQFAGGDADVVTFADWDQLSVIAVFRRLRDFVIEKFSLEDADRILPSVDLDWMQTQAAQAPDHLPDDPPGPSFAEPQPKLPKDTIMADQAELDARAKALAEREAQLNAQTADFAAREASARKADNDKFLNGLVAAGKLAPALVPQVAKFMARLDHQEVVSFAEGDEGQKTPHDFFRDLLGQSGQVVNFSELSAKETHVTGTADFAAPAGAVVSQGRLDLHVRATAYAAQHNVPYLTAVSVMERQG